jgi:hypothetical protein
MSDFLEVENFSIEDDFSDLVEGYLDNDAFASLAGGMLGGEWKEKGAKIVKKKLPSLYDKFMKKVG